MEWMKEQNRHRLRFRLEGLPDDPTWPLWVRWPFERAAGDRTPQTIRAAIFRRLPLWLQRLALAAVGGKHETLGQRRDGGDKED